MRVIGGIYRERCPTKNWDQIFGSAGRAACVLAGVFGQKVKLDGWFSKRKLAALQASFAPYDIELNVRVTSNFNTFEYFHPLAIPTLNLSSTVTWSGSDLISDKVILAFGAIEGLPRIIAKRLIVDPQNVNLVELLKSEQLKAQSIAVVANEEEVSLNAASSVKVNVRAIFRLNSNIEVVVVKRGPAGALVFEKNKRPAKINPYSSEQVFKIGSGDVFSAVFALMWGKKNKSSVESADLASRSVACYVADPSLNFRSADLKRASPIIAKRESAQIYLAAPFFNLSDELFLDEARQCLSKFGIKVFSPLHHVGKGHSKIVAAKDIKGLRESNAVLALMHNSDPGTIFEIGYARSIGVPVVAFCEAAVERDLTMLEGTGCQIEYDFCSALYKAFWAAIT